MAFPALSPRSLKSPFSNYITRSLAPFLDCLRFGQLLQYPKGKWLLGTGASKALAGPSASSAGLCSVVRLHHHQPTWPGFPRHHRSMSSSLALALPQMDSGQPAQAGSKGNFYVPWHCHLGLIKRTPFFFLTTLFKT